MISDDIPFIIDSLDISFSHLFTIRIREILMELVDEIKSNKTEINDLRQLTDQQSIEIETLKMILTEHGIGV